MGKIAMAAALALTMCACSTRSLPAGCRVDPELLGQAERQAPLPERAMTADEVDAALAKSLAYGTKTADRLDELAGQVVDNCL